MSILITGCTGSMGRVLVDHFKKKSLVIGIARNEANIVRMRLEHPECKFYPLDITKYGLSQFDMVDTIIHCAAIKHVSTGEDFPLLAVDNNINGTANVLNFSVDKKAIMISTDKAYEPSNVYGATKLIAERLWLNAGKQIIRGGNFIGSSGSVLEIYRNLLAQGIKELPVTDENCTRYWMTKKDLINSVKLAIAKDQPIIYAGQDKRFRIIDLVIALGGIPVFKGLRPGEKEHEKMHEFCCSDRVNMTVEDIKRELKCI